MNSMLKRGSWMVTIPVAGLVASYLFFVLLPTRNAIKQLERDIQSKRQFATQGAALSQSASETLTEIEQTRRHIDEQSSHIAAGREDVLGVIARSAKQANVITTRFDPDSQSAYESFERNRVSLGIKGTFDAVADFVRRLEALPAMVWIDDLAISRLQEDGKNVHCEIKLEIFALKSEKTNQVEFAGRR